MASDPIRDWHQIAVELLMTDADLALQSIALIFSRDDKAAVQRLVHNTRDVYDSIQTKRKQIALSASEAEALDAKMDELRERLKLLEERV